MKTIEFIEKKELISKFAKEMADYVLIYATELKEFASKLGICEEMYQEAYKLYDFRNAGHNGYMTQEQLEKLKDWYDTPTEDF